MKVTKNSLDRIPGTKQRQDGFSNCSCGKCDRIFFQKSTVIKWLEPILEKYKDLPLNVVFQSLKLPNGMMSVQVTIVQTADMTAKAFPVLKEDE